MDFSMGSTLEIALGTFIALAVMTIITILLGKWINKAKEHFEAV